MTDDTNGNGPLITIDQAIELELSTGIRVKPGATAQAMLDIWVKRMIDFHERRRRAMEEE
jgi:hypothetical protein